jgi:hypothetical protein
MAEEQAQTLNVDGRTYRLADLSEEARAQVVSIRTCDQRIQQLRADLQITAAARAAYLQTLNGMLPEPIDTAADAAGGDSAGGDAAAATGAE